MESQLQESLIYTTFYTMYLLLTSIEDGIPTAIYQRIPSVQEPPLHAGVVIYKNRIVIPPSLWSACLSAPTLPIRAHLAWSQRQKHPSFGLASHKRSKPPEPIAHLATGWQSALPPSPPTLAEYPFQCKYVSALTTITTKAAIPEKLESPSPPLLSPFPHSNCRAEVGVKTVLRLITGSVGKDILMHSRKLYFNIKTHLTQAQNSLQPCASSEDPSGTSSLDNIAHTKLGETPWI